MRIYFSQWLEANIFKKAGVGIISASFLFATGCGGLGGGPQGAMAPGGDLSQNVAIPAEMNATKAPLGVDKLHNLARSNPFESLLISDQIPEPEMGPDPEETGTTPIVEQPPPPPPTDPFTGFSLGGIIYRGGKNSLAILVLPSGNSQIVRQGDYLYGAEGSGVQVRVKDIAQRSVELETVDPPADFPPEMRRKALEVVSLVGFKSSSVGASKTTPKTKPGKSDAGGATDATPAVARGQLDQAGQPIGNQGHQFESMDSLGHDGPPINYSQDAGYATAPQGAPQNPKRPGN